MAAAAILDNFEWPYLRNGSRSTYIARIARSSLRWHSFLVCLNQHSVHQGNDDTSRQATAVVDTIDKISVAVNCNLHHLVTSAKSVCICIILIIFTRDSIYAIARICYRPSVCPSVTRVDISQQESCAIAKMTARCVLGLHNMGALKTLP